MQVNEWDFEADVVVVGYGGAGVVAALTAREAGADVLAIDRYLGGGATELSGGVVYAGGGTRIQREAGIDDDPENMFSYLRAEVGDAVSEHTLRRFCEESAGMIDWLGDHGVPFAATPCPYKTSYPTDEYYLYYSGSENSGGYRERARPCPRGHRAHGRGVSGKKLFGPLAASAARRGVRVHTGTRAHRLIVEDDRVVGVEARSLHGAPAAVRRRFAALVRVSAKPGVYHRGLRRALTVLLDRIETRHGTPVRIRARSAVILTTGGFIANGEMVSRHAPGYPWAEGLPLGTAADDGAGITMATELGAATGNMDRLSAWRFIAPPSAFFAGLAVNARGQRMIDESRYGAALGGALAFAPGHRGWLLIDADIERAARAQLAGQSVWFQRMQTEYLMRLGRSGGGTIEEAATRAGVDPVALRETVDAHNRAIAAGTADPLGKPDAVRRPVQSGPFALLDISFRSRIAYPMPMITLGGLRVHEQTGAVLRAGGGAVPGLFAAGRAAVGVCSNSYVSGLSLADAVFSGRRAGANTGR